MSSVPPVWASVSVVIPTYNGAATLHETLAAVQTQDYPGPVEIVAVDSDSTDATPALLEQSGAKVVHISRKRFTHGYSRNLGVQKAVGEILVFMSQDALPEGSQWLRGIVSVLADPQVGAMYVRQKARPDATPFEEYFHLQLYPPKSARYYPPKSDALSLDRIFFSNVCSAARREICLRFPFDETIIMSEDQVFAKTLLSAGYQTVYNAEIIVIHSHRYTLRTLFRRNFDSAYSLRSVTHDGGLRIIGRALEYVLGEIEFVIRRRRWRWLLYVLPYEAVRTAGRLLGSQANWIPLRWRVALSLHRGYWTRETPI